MIDRSDWQTVEDDFTEDDLYRYSTGLMTPEEEERMRARIESDPDLAQALAVPFPSEDEVEPLPEAEVSRRWTDLQTQLPPKTTGAKILQFWRASTALAAAMALVFGALLWRSNARREPRVLADAYLLGSDGRRGEPGRPVMVQANGEPVVLSVPLFDTHRRHRLELVNEQDRVLWRSGVLMRPVEDAYRIELSLDRGKYKVVLYGVDSAREEKVDTYSLRVR